MSFEWSSYLSLAKKLNEKSGEEYRRSAISRVYYYTYHRTKSHLESAGIIIPKRNPHAALIEFLGSHHMWLAHELARLRDYRNQADYDLIFPYNQEWVSTMIARAEQFVRAIETLPTH